MSRLVAHLDKQYNGYNPKKPGNLIKPITDLFQDSTLMSAENSRNLQSFLEKNFALIEGLLFPVSVLMISVFTYSISTICKLQQFNYLIQQNYRKKKVFIKLISL